MAEETETLDKVDPQWRLLVQDLFGAVERLEAAKKEVIAAEQDVRTVMRVARRIVTEDKGP